MRHGVTRFISGFMAAILLTSVLTGCWSRRELNQLILVSAIGVDKEEDQIKVSLQIINPLEVATASNTSGSGETAVSMYEITGPSLFVAMRRMTTKLPRRPYYAHMQLVVIGESLAREGMAPYLDMLLRDHDFRSDFYIIVARDNSASEILQKVTPIEKLPPVKLKESLQISAMRWGSTVDETFENVMQKLLMKKQAVVLNGVTVQGDMEAGGSLDNLKRVLSPAVLHYTPPAIFRQDKLIDWMDENEAIGYNYIQDQIDNTLISLPCGQGEQATIEIISTQSQMRWHDKEDSGYLQFDLKVEGNVADFSCTEFDLTKQATFTQLEQRLASAIQDRMEQAIGKARRLNSDFIGFGLEISRRNPKRWEQWKADWDRQHFQTIEFKFNIDPRIQQSGQVERAVNKLLKNPEPGEN